jgi:hypothetical protein
MLTAFTTAVNYDDYLRVTLPYTLKIADRVVVITAPADPGICVAEELGADVFVTDAFYAKGTAFAKGCGINAALQANAEQLKDSWILHLDADVVTTDDLRPKLAHLDQTWLYGANRYGVYDRQRLARLIKGESFRRVNMSRHNSRPIGFYQLWHGSTGIIEYPTLSSNASWDDMEHIKKFGPRRKLITSVYHLMTHDLTRKANWDGRTTSAF